VNFEQHWRLSKKQSLLENSPIGKKRVRKCSNQREASIQPNKMALNIFGSLKGKFLENSNKYYSLICFRNCAETGFNLAHHHRVFYQYKTSSSLGSGLKQSSFVKIFKSYLVAQSLEIRVVLRTQMMFPQRSLEHE
jgi:hypothetical protein